MCVGGKVCGQGEDIFTDKALSQPLHAVRTLLQLTTYFRCRESILVLINLLPFWDKNGQDDEIKAFLYLPGHLLVPACDCLHNDCCLNLTLNLSLSLSLNCSMTEKCEPINLCQSYAA